MNGIHQSDAANLFVGVAAGCLESAQTTTEEARMGWPLLRHCARLAAMVMSALLTSPTAHAPPPRLLGHAPDADWPGSVLVGALAGPLEKSEQLFLP